MPSRSRARSGSSNSPGVIALVSLLAIVAVGLSVAAVSRADPRPVGDPVATPSAAATPAPSPTPSITPTPTPTPTLALPALAPAQERFLALDSTGTAWRATAGSCASGEPAVLERSSDDGATWQDVTPRYLDLRQIVAVTPFAPGESEMIAAVGPDCAVEGLRTYTQGVFWEQYAGVLDGKSYLSVGDPAIPVTPIGAPPPPCAAPTSLSVDNTAATLVCDARTLVWSTGDAEWREVPVRPARAALLTDGTITVAHAAADCVGVAVSRAPLSELGAAQTTCVPGVDPAAAAALASDPRGGAALWSGDTLVRVG